MKVSTGASRNFFILAQGVQGDELGGQAISD
jgi:hypothetical protein